MRDILATLTEVTALTIARAIKQKEKSINEIIACGGGIKNIFLMERIGHHVSSAIVSSKTMGYDPQVNRSYGFRMACKTKA